MPVGQDVVAKRAGIADARFGKIGDQLGKVLSRGRAVTDGTNSERPLQRLEAAVDLLECLLQPVAIRHLVKIAMVTDLVSGRDNLLAGRGMGKRRPSGREECRLHREFRHQFDDPGDADARIVAAWEVVTIRSTFEGLLPIHAVSASRRSR